MARSAQCECANNFTCGHCFANRKPYHFTSGDGRRVYVGNVVIPIVNPEPCYRLVQIGRGEPITCQCSRCRQRGAG